jgi:hypothetical protein
LAGLCFIVDLLIPTKYDCVNNFLIPKTMKKKMGRPELPEGESKDIQIGVRFNSEIGQIIEEESAKLNQTKSDWVRNAAIEETRMRSWWVKSKWALKDLDGKPVEFTLTDKGGGGKRKGMGKFLVRENMAGKLCIYIVTQINIAEIRYVLFQGAANKIERHPDQSVAEFRLLA